MPPAVSVRPTLLDGRTRCREFDCDTTLKSEASIQNSGRQKQICKKFLNHNDILLDPPSVVPYHTQLVHPETKSLPRPPTRGKFLAFLRGKNKLGSLSHPLSPRLFNTPPPAQWLAQNPASLSMTSVRTRRRKACMPSFTAKVRAT